jgi:hypothetical protein
MENTKKCACGKLFNLVPGRDQDRCKECVRGHRPAAIRRLDRMNRESQNPSTK